MSRSRGGGGELRGVRVLVTGATSGIGRAMAEALVAAGATVAITGREVGRAQRVAEEMPEGSGQAIGIAMDVRDDHQVERGVREVMERLGGLEALVNNAGLGMRAVNPQFLTMPQPFWKVDRKAFREVIATNLTGYFLVAGEVVPHLLRAGRGRIVNISMNHTTMRRPGFVPYGPSRAGAESLSQIMAADLAGTETGMIPEDVPLEVRSNLLSPRVMAAPICWLCSAAAEGVTGERIVAIEFDRWLSLRTGPELGGAVQPPGERSIPER
jgi:gluconate 5-dehydrogenase